MPADIRTAIASDVDDLAALEEAVFQGDRISRRSFRRLIEAPTAIVLVMADEAGLAGYCIVLLRSSASRARLYSLAAASGRAGVGRPLLAAAENAAAARGRARLGLEVRKDNSRAIALYERAGFRRCGEIANYYDDDMAALRFEKELKGAGKTSPAHYFPPTGTAAA
jgi:ribosomal protein S18 acetylase RimI-like enzyme